MHLRVLRDVEECALHQISQQGSTGLTSCGELVQNRWYRFCFLKDDYELMMI